MKTHQQLYDFMNHYKIGVIATVNDDGRPNAAIIGFGQDDTLKLYFGTENTSRKYHNLLRDPHLAFTIGGETPETIQLEGVARELMPEEIDLIREHYWPKNPQAEAHHNNPRERYFCVTPNWLRYTNIGVEPWDITELNL